jgi:SAM-dependent methyltransferase
MDNTSAEFDKFAKDYYDESRNDLGKYGKYRDTAFIYKAQLLKYILKVEPKKILDFGCGIGSNIPYLHNYFDRAKLYGCDISAESIEVAKKNYQYCNFNVINNINDLQIYNDIDCIFISTVFHHIPVQEHEYWINGLYNILKENKNDTGGHIIIFEHNMKNPLTKLTVKKSKIDEEAIMLNPKYCKRLLLNRFYKTRIGDKEILLKKDVIKLKYTYFFPWRNRFFTLIEHLLFWLPLGAQYCVYAKK